MLLLVLLAIYSQRRSQYGGADILNPVYYNNAGIDSSGVLQPPKLPPGYPSGTDCLECGAKKSVTSAPVQGQRLHRCMYVA